MAFNIVDLVRDQISDPLLGQMGSVLGTDGTKTSTAVGSALPGLLAGLASATGKPGGDRALLETARAQDDGMLDKLGTLLGGEDGSQVIEQGNSMLGSILGESAVGKLGGVLASFVDISRSGSGSLMGMLAPVVLGAIKRKMTESDLDASGLSRLFDEQRPNIDAAMPDGLAEQLRSESFFDSIAPAPARTETVESVAPAAAATTAEPARPAPAAAPAASSPPENATSSGNGMMRWLLPLAAVVVLGLIAWSFLGGEDAEDAPAVVVTEEEAEAAAAVDLPEGVDVDRITGALGGVFASTRDTLEDVTDEASARAALPALKEANATLGGLNDVITRLPEAARPPIDAAVAGGLANLRPLADRILGMPAVGPVVEPVLGPMLETLEGLAGG